MNNLVKLLIKIIFFVNIYKYRILCLINIKINDKFIKIYIKL